MDKNSKIYVAGHKGMLGSAILKLLTDLSFENVVVRHPDVLDLCNQDAVDTFFASEKPEYVFLAAAKVGGILANNKQRADFFYKNLMIEVNIINAAYINGVKKLLLLGSSSIYPKICDHPYREEDLLSGPLEYTSQPYAIAKIAALEMCHSYLSSYGCNFISAITPNLYGTKDNYNVESGQVIASLIQKFLYAKKNQLPQVSIWGSGNAIREFMHVDDLADACFFLMQQNENIPLINISSGASLSIKDLGILIKDIVGFNGNIDFDTSKPDGIPIKLMDNSKINSLRWSPKIDIGTGLKMVIEEVRALHFNS